MARIRSVKPQLRTSLTVAEWPREVRYFWVLLWGYLDDHGRGVDDPRLIKADCFPLDDDLTRVDIDDWLTMIAKTPDDEGDLPTLCRYEVRGHRYVHAPKWTGHQRPQHPKDSEIPVCPVHDNGSIPEKSSGKPHEDLTPEVEVYREVEVKGGGVARPPDATREPPRSKPKRRLPDDFAPTEAMKTWAREHAPLVGKRDHDAFCDYWRGNGTTKADWPATWRNWMRKAQTDAERNGATRSRASPSPKPSTTDERVGAALALAAEFRTEANGQLGIAS